MNFVILKSCLNKKPVKILLIILALGVLLTALPFLTAPNQCPNSYTQQQVNDSNCIVGADIGSGMIMMLGISIIFVSFFGLFVSFIESATKISSKTFGLAVILILIGPFIILIGIINAPVSNKEAIFESVGGCPEFAEIINDYCDKPKSSPDAVIDYSNTIVLIGTASLFSGGLLSAYSIYKHRAN